MDRTTIMLPQELKSRALRKARSKGISLAELIRLALESQLAEARDPRDADPLMKDSAIFDGEAPEDLSANHDAYLYEDAP
jgi:hypothetical protein